LLTLAQAHSRKDCVIAGAVTEYGRDTVLKTLFGRNATEDERALQLRKLNEALRARVKRYTHDNENRHDVLAADKPE
jgi:hypothetical protein